MGAPTPRASPACSQASLKGRNHHFPPLRMPLEYLLPPVTIPLSNVTASRTWSIHSHFLLFLYAIINTDAHYVEPIRVPHLPNTRPASSMPFHPPPTFMKVHRSPKSLFLPRVEARLQLISRIPTKLPRVRTVHLPYHFGLPPV